MRTFYCPVEDTTCPYCTENGVCTLEDAIVECDIANAYYTEEDEEAEAEDWNDIFNTFGRVEDGMTECELEDPDFDEILNALGIMEGDEL